MLSACRDKWHFMPSFRSRSCSPQDPSPPPAPPGLVGAWAFAEGNGTTTADSSGNGNAGTLVGASWTPLGRYGSAVSFNGAGSTVRGDADESEIERSYRPPR